MGERYSQRGLVVGEAGIGLRIGLGGWGRSQLPSNKCQEHPGDRGGEAGLPPLFGVQGSEAREIRAVAWSARPGTPSGDGCGGGQGSREDSARAREPGSGSGPGARARERD